MVEQGKIYTNNHGQVGNGHPKEGVRCSVIPLLYFLLAVINIPFQYFYWMNLMPYPHTCKITKVGNEVLMRTQTTDQVPMRFRAKLICCV